jgi:dual specificity protein kinase YAK1
MSRDDIQISKSSPDKTGEMFLHEGAFTKCVKVDVTENTKEVSRSTLRFRSTQNRENLLFKTTSKLLDVYKGCNREFRYMPGLNPRRCLTIPAEAEPGSCDNVEGDFVLYANQIIVSSSSGKRYTILDKVGKGTFGQVAKCMTDDGCQFAIKIVRSKQAYTNQALVEHMILSQLNGENRCKYIVKYYECFMHQNHLCLVFELLAVNLYDLLRQNKFKGLSLNLIRMIVKQCLEALVAIGDKNIVHCDLKPENIMLQSTTSPQIKIIDFGSACLEHQAVYTYIQSRFYRSPEVLLRLSYERGIDVWSLACIGAELFLGLPLWPGTCEFNQMCKMVESLGIPPVEMLDKGKWTLKFFNRIEHAGTHSYQLKSPAQFEQENACILPQDRRYFRYTKVGGAQVVCR